MQRPLKRRRWCHVYFNIISAVLVLWSVVRKRIVYRAKTTFWALHWQKIEASVWYLDRTVFETAVILGSVTGCLFDNEIVCALHLLISTLESSRTIQH